MDFFTAEKLTRDAIESVQRGAWTLAETAGRLVEISGSMASASLTVAFGLVWDAQQQGEPVGWVMSQGSSFYPPDVAQGGVDLQSLVVVRVPESRAISRAGEKLLRSGAFGLIVLDIGGADIPMPLQSRLAGLARQHHAALLCLTAKERSRFSLGSLVSLRVHARRVRASENHFACELKVLKDKQHGPTWSHVEICRGPAGLC